MVICFTKGTGEANIFIKDIRVKNIHFGYWGSSPNLKTLKKRNGTGLAKNTAEKDTFSAVFLLKQSVYFTLI